MNYDLLQQELAKAFEKALNGMGDKTQELSWFCTQEEQDIINKGKNV
jgi:hypothetical protein